MSTSSLRNEHSVTTVSWIPSDLLEGMGKIATRMKMAHHDPPPPTSLGADIPATLEELRITDGFRFANHLRAFIVVDDSSHIISAGYSGGGVMGSTTVGLAVGSITVPAIRFEDRRSEPEIGTDFVRFTQTVGGRTGAPMPRAVKHPPFVQYHAPIVWTTLELIIRTDGTHEATFVGASGFPRHWLFDDSGSLVAKSSLAEYKKWMNESFGHRTPWGDEDSPTLVTAVESALERDLQGAIMRGSQRPEIRRIRAGGALVEQGSPSDELFLLLNGILVVEVDGEKIAELGPGAVLGERALLDGGIRTATLRAVTECKVAAVRATDVDTERLAQLAAGHRREGVDRHLNPGLPAAVSSRPAQARCATFETQRPRAPRTEP